MGVLSLHFGCLAEEAAINTRIFPFKCRCRFVHKRLLNFIFLASFYDKKIFCHIKSHGGSPETQCAHTNFPFPEAYP